MRSALSGSIKNKPGRSGVPLTLIAPLRASALRSATALPPLQPGVTFNKARTIEKRFCPRPSLQQFQTRPSLRAKRSNPFQSSSSLRAADESPREAIHNFQKRISRAKNLIFRRSCQNRFPRRYHQNLRRNPHSHLRFRRSHHLQNRQILPPRHLHHRHKIQRESPQAG